MKLSTSITSAVLVMLASALAVGAQQCGRQAGGARCPNNQCCSLWGYCGDNADFCDNNCLYDCWDEERSDHRCGSDVGDPPCGQYRCCSNSGWCGSGRSYCREDVCDYQCDNLNSAPALQTNATAKSVREVMTESLFEEMFPLRKQCPSQRFYSYHAFLAAAESFPAFATTGDVATRKREIAAFLAHVSHATSEKRSDLENPFRWGLCHVNTTAYDTDFCTSTDWPCAAAKTYSPRGAIQLAHNFNYGVAGQALGVDLITKPELVATDPIVSFKTAVWLWMTKHDNKPSCHDIVLNAAKIPINGVIGDIISRASGHGISNASSVGFYKRYCDLMGVSYGNDLKLWFDNTPSSRIQIPVVAY